MKKILFMLALVLPMLAFVSCSDDDEDGVTLTKEAVVGTWNVTWLQQGGESINVPNGAIWINLYDDNSYSVMFIDNHYTGTYKIEGSTVVGTTRDPITEYFRFTSLNGSIAEIDYSNSTGDKYKFRAAKE